MDELTVTTVARGLARLLRLWQAQAGGAGWRVLMLLHDEGSLERLRHETPCAGYLLPWLSPHDEPAKPLAATAPAASVPATEDAARLRQIKLMKSLLKPELQSLARIVGPGAPSLEQTASARNNLG